VVNSLGNFLLYSAGARQLRSAGRDSGVIGRVFCCLLASPVCSISVLCTAEKLGSRHRSQGLWMRYDMVKELA